MALAANALTLVATAESTLGITPGSMTARLEALINGASESIEQWCGRKFGRVVGKVEKLAGYDTTDLRPALTPIESVASISFDGTTIDPTSYSIDTEKPWTIYREIGWAWTAGLANAVAPYAMPGTESKLFTLTYTAGFALAVNNRTPGTYVQPYDLEEACLALISYRLKMTPKNVGLAGEQAGNASRTYASKSGGGAAAVPDYIAGMLEPYARVR